MRTKVERSYEKTGQQKSSISLPSPKVVLNANDCAKLLDNMGKAAVLLEEEEDKGMAANLEASLGQVSAAPITLYSSMSSSSSVKNGSSSILAANQAKLCNTWDCSTSTNNNKSSKNTNLAAANKPSTEKVKDDQQSISVQTQTILKPLKKRRGIDKKFEDIAQTAVFSNNGDSIYPVVSTTGEDPSSLLQRGAAIPPVSMPSRKKSFQKHSVEQLLQNPSVSTVSEKALVSTNYSHDLLSSPFDSLSSSSSNSSSLSKNIDNYQERALYAPQLYRHNFSTANKSCQNHKYSGHADSAEISPLLPHSRLFTKKTLPNPADFQHVPEQIEPMNLSTTSKLDLSPDSCNFPSTSNSQTNNEVSEDTSKTHSHDFTEPSKAFSLSHSLKSKPKFKRERTMAKQTIKKVFGTPEDISSHASLCSEVSLVDNYFHGSSSGIPVESNTNKPVQARKPQDSAVDPLCHTTVCVEKPHREAEKDSVCDNANNHVADKSSMAVITNVCILEESNSQRWPPETVIQSSETVIQPPDTVIQPPENVIQFVEPVISPPENVIRSSETVIQPPENVIQPLKTDILISENIIKPPETVIQLSNSTLNSSVLFPASSMDNECSDVIKCSNNSLEQPIDIDNNTLVKKTKRPPKKKEKLPMDERSCADRTLRYLSTIDDVIANFVYLPEPLEEFSLTEEEEAALRDQFKDVQAGSNNCEIQCAIEHASETTEMNADPDKQSSVSETSSGISPKKVLASLVAESSPESHQDLSKTVEHIDSILAYVARDFSNSEPQKCYGDVNTNKQKTIRKNLDLSSKERNKKVLNKMDRNSNKITVQMNTNCGNELNCLSIENGEPINVTAYNKDNQTESLKKTKKIKKSKLETSVSLVTEKTYPLVEGVNGGVEDNAATPLKKTFEGKLKNPKKNKTGNKEKCSSADPVTTQCVLVADKEAVGSNRAETSDIGESIASTSGGSEQDTPIHEPELKDEITSTDPQIIDRENHDTGLESGGEDKPVRRYKKRLDFVKCDQCEHQARGRSALSRHMKKIHLLDVNMPFKCQHCDYGCTKMASLNRHLFTHGVFPCSRCSFVTQERIKLSEHVMEQHKDKLDVKMCKVCNRYIKCNLITIEQHSQECQGPTPFQCTECEKEFKYASSLRVHYHTHFPDQPKRFKCEQCDYRTNYKANLHKHHKNMHATKGPDVQCPECGKLFSTEDNMRRHRKVHTLIRPFACETCEKTFKTSGALRGHQMIHTATRPYTCEIPGCSRTFRTPKFLKSHKEEFHRLVPKKFFCSVEGCNYSFFKRSHLKRHAITHTGERNFHCTWPGCSKSFRHADNLKVHFRSHSNEKPVQCHLCDFKCKQKNSLFWHKKRVHQIIDMSMYSRPSKLKPTAVLNMKSSRNNEHNVTPIVEADIQEIKVSKPSEVTAELASGDIRNVTIVSEVLVREKTETPVLDCHLKAKESKVQTFTEVLKIPKKTPSKSTIGDESHASSSEVKCDLHQCPVLDEQGSRTSIGRQERVGHLDMYEFKSDEESGDETPGNFRRDKNVMSVLPPLPPPPKELLLKNEILEMKEKEKKEKAERKEQERKEKAERKEHEKHEKNEKKNLEKKVKAEHKELEKKEKVIKKEQEKKERIEKKELEKKEKLKQKEIEKKVKIEQKQLEKKEKIEKMQLEKKEKIERKEQTKNVKAGKFEMQSTAKTSLSIETHDKEIDNKCNEKIVKTAKNPPRSLKRRKSPDVDMKENQIEAKKQRQGRRKITEDINGTFKNGTPKIKENETGNNGYLLLRKKVSCTKKEQEGKEKTTTLVKTFVGNVESSALRNSVVRRSKRKVKLVPQKRKPSARIKAKKKAHLNKKSSLKVEKSSSKSDQKRVSVRKRSVLDLETKEEAGSVDGNSKTDEHVDGKSEGNNILSEEIKVVKLDDKDTLAVPKRPASPASSEEIMVQGNASPYRDFYDDENLEDQAERPASSLSQEKEDCPDVLEVSDADETHVEKNDLCLVEKHASNPLVEEYSDDEVSNDIPLTPPRAPAPPPMESSEDEMEQEPESTPFSVPGPNTPFSIPPPTNLMQQHSVQSEETSVSAVPSVPSMDIHSQDSADMQKSLEATEIHSRGSVERSNSHGSMEIHHRQSSFEIPHKHGPGDVRSYNSVEMRSHSSVESVQTLRSGDNHESVTETISHSDQQARTPENVMRDMSSNTLSDKYELLPSLQEQTQTSEADKEYFDQYLKSLSAANNRRDSGSLESSPSGLQQLEAMVGKPHFDSKEMLSKSPISCLPTSVITSLEGTLPLLTHHDLRARMDALVSERHHESLYIRETPSSLPRLPDRQTPLPSSSLSHSPAFDAFPSLNPLHPTTAGGGRENSYLRQPENLFPTPPGTSSFMAEAMFQRQAVGTPFLPPQPGDRNSFSRISETTQLRRPGPVPGSDMFSPPTMAQSIPRHPFTNAWASQEVRPAHWQTPYLSHQTNMATTGHFFPSKDNYFTGRDFMFDPSVRPSTERSMFPSLSSSQSQDFQLDRFDLSNYFPNAMTPYGSSTGPLEYSRAAHNPAAKPFDDRYRQTTASCAPIPDFRGLPPTGSSADMFSGLSGVNSSFNLYAGNPMSYHTQHMTDNVNSAFLTHSTSAQHAMFERDYAAAHRGFYPQNTPYPFVDDRQYPGASKLGHTHPVAPTPVPQDRDLMSRSAAPESQMQDPYRSLLYRY